MWNNQREWERDRNLLEKFLFVEWKRNRLVESNTCYERALGCCWVEIKFIFLCSEEKDRSSCIFPLEVPLLVGLLRTSGLSLLDGCVRHSGRRARSAGATAGPVKQLLRPRLWWQFQGLFRGTRAPSPCHFSAPSQNHRNRLQVSSQEERGVTQKSTFVYFFVFFYYLNFYCRH